MPEYEFQTPAGELRTRVMAMADAPAIGATIDIDGVPCTRIVSRMNVSAADFAHKRFPYVSRSLPPHLAGEKTTKGGRVVVKNKEHERRLAAKTGMVKEN